MTKFKILVCDSLGKKGLDALQQEKAIQADIKTGLSEAELIEIIGQYDAVLVRSTTRITAPVINAAKKLRVIGRAGVGVDNVDLDAATKQGVIVMNTPEGNTISTCEHTLSLLLSMARNIPQAHASLKKGEWNRGKFVGTELHDKTLGIVGLGRIGREVAFRAKSFGMKVIAFDPFITQESMRKYEISFATLEDLLKRSDFITVHVPLTSETKGLIGAKQFGLVKKGLYIINCARGGIIDEQALNEALRQGKVRGAALDVFEVEPPVNNPLFELPQVVVTPHLGAATEEAQENVAVAVVNQVIDALLDRGINNAVNMPSLDASSMKTLKPWVQLAEKIGLLHTQLFGAVSRLMVRYGGELTQYKTEPVGIAVLKGLLTPICGEGVNFVNAPALAKERSIIVEESKTTEIEDFTNYIEVISDTEGKKNIVTGTLFGNHDLRIVRINEFRLDAIPRGVVLLIYNEDQPGVVGGIGSILGKNSINIAEMTLARIKKDGKMYALTVINTDNDVPQKVLVELTKFPPIIEVKVAKL